MTHPEEAADPVAALNAIAAGAVDLPGQVAFLERLLAVVAGRIGPIQVSGSQFNAAAGADLQQVLPVSIEDAEVHDAPVVWALADHIGADGQPVTVLERVASVLRELSYEAPEIQALAVMRELGLMLPAE